MSATIKPAENGTNDQPDQYMRKRSTKTKWQTIRDGIYNPSKGKVLGKTGKQWGITGLFYLCFFTGLAILCAICYKGLEASLSKQEPRWKLDSSLIGTSPGLGFRPISENTKSGSIIAYNAANTTQVDMWVARLNKFLENYLHTSQSPAARPNQQPCSHDFHNLTKGKVCAVDINSWNPCSPKEEFGFRNSSPCVFIKLNRIYDWVPDYYNDSSNLPEEMPESLVNHIKSVKGKELNTVWVSCNGRHGIDRELLNDSIEYLPRGPQGFPGYYYPYTNTPGYLSPLVAVHFRRPAVNQLIFVECRAWAKNIKYDRKEKLGMVSFELQIDDRPKPKQKTGSIDL
ncbi:sodium/potassium-transporting ATPase subunit beta-1 [Diachasma alloeum]|uniref:sodium/potassium-transporting ATPase subunit beta-1 n=1 Tax=Diachasma alloeum TaxID=454923 RepID=UPI0007384CA4|nr:sodium/potassium-transporting ATPase subunit beta-1 [Diachasma alloeum]